MKNLEQTRATIIPEGYYWKSKIDKFPKENIIISISSFGYSILLE